MDSQRSSLKNFIHLGALIRQPEACRGLELRKVTRGRPADTVMSQALTHPAPSACNFSMHQGKMDGEPEK